MKKTLLSVLITLAIVVSMIPAFGVTVSAAEMCTVTFHNNGHGTLKVESIQIEKGKSLQGSGLLSYRSTLMGKADGLQHSGWGKTASAVAGSKDEYNMNTTVEGDMDLYAIWSHYIDHIELSLPESSKPVAGALIPAEPKVDLIFPTNPVTSETYYEIYYSDADWIKDTVWLDEDEKPVTSGTFKNNQKYTLRVNVYSWVTYKAGPLPFTVDTNLDTVMINATLDGRQADRIMGDLDSNVILYFDFEIGTVPTKFKVKIWTGEPDKGHAEPGETVIIKADEDFYEHGHFCKFDHWKVVEGGVTLKDPKSRTTTFVMPANDVEINAYFTEVSNEITKDVILNLEKPVPGTKPASTPWCAGAKLSSLTWYRWVSTERGIMDWEKMPSNVSFQEGKKYMAEIMLIPEIGYEFAPQSELSLTFNNIPFNESVVTCNANQLCIRKEFTATTPSANPFIDVYESDNYYDAVLWAYYASPQVTNGMDETHFGPHLTVTRAQAVPFLWRSQGCPEPSSTVNPFVDVPSTEYYYKPILWAVEKGITKGVDDTHFNPMDTLSTQHIVTFLFRTKNPGMDGWNGEAAAWAGQGYGGKPFGVDIAVNNTTPCPRCNVVQFLYKLSK